MQGDLGWITEEQVVPEVAQAIIKAEKGKYLDLVKSTFGWHIIIVDDVREAAPPSFEEVKKDLETMVQTEKLQDFLDKVRENAKIDYPNKDKLTDKTDEK
jgi:peptidyl-prolyl cis-trans isomerase C